MARSLGESLPFILAALLVGLFVGWLLWGRNRTGRPAASGAAGMPAPSTVSAAESKPAADTHPAVDRKPESGSEHGSHRKVESDQESVPESRPEVVVQRQPASADRPGSHRQLEPAAGPKPRLVPVTAAESPARTLSPAGTEDAVVATPVAASASPAAAAPAAPVEPSAVAVPAATAQPAVAGEQPAAGKPSTSAKRSAAAPAVVTQPAVRPEPAPGTPAAAPQQEPGAGSVPPAGPSSGPVDDLARVEGIGPKIAAALVAAGIRSYRDLAGADVETLRAALRSAGLRFVPSLPSWPEQARLLADDDTAGLAALTDRLIAGREPAAEAVPTPAVTPQSQRGPVVSTQPTATSNGSAAGPRPSPGPDDLKRIEGIGPKMASALNAAGITTFEGLAAADETTIRAAISAAGLRFAPSLVTWAEQARLLADGDQEGFASLAGDLVAGRMSPVPEQNPMIPPV